MALRVVLTGGVCAGKSTVFRRLQSQLDVPTVYVPEAATQVFEEGQPKPDDSWNENDYVSLQRAIAGRQSKLEAVALREAEKTGAVPILQDRGIYDVLAFRGGEAGFVLELASRGLHDCFTELNLAIRKTHPAEHGLAVAAMQ